MVNSVAGTGNVKRVAGRTNIKHRDLCGDLSEGIGPDFRAVVGKSYALSTTN